MSSWFVQFRAMNCYNAAKNEFPSSSTGWWVDCVKNRQWIDECFLLHSEVRFILVLMFTLPPKRVSFRAYVGNYNSWTIHYNFLDFTISRHFLKFLQIFQNFFHTLSIFQWTRPHSQTSTGRTNLRSFFHRNVRISPFKSKWRWKTAFKNLHQYLFTTLFRLLIMLILNFDTYYQIIKNRNNVKLSNAQ